MDLVKANNPRRHALACDYELVFSQLFGFRIQMYTNQSREVPLNFNGLHSLGGDHLKREQQQQQQQPSFRES
jgi:hypothetical protein